MSLSHNNSMWEKETPGTTVQAAQLENDFLQTRSSEPQPSQKLPSGLHPSQTLPCIRVKTLLNRPTNAPSFRVVHLRVKCSTCHKSCPQHIFFFFHTYRRTLLDQAIIDGVYCCDIVIDSRATKLLFCSQSKI